MRLLRICFSLFVLQIALAACATVTGTVEVVSSNAHSRPLSDIVVWLEPETPAQPATEPMHARLLQKNKMFRPHVLAIRTGTVVDFPNADPIFHNAFSTYDGQNFDVGLYPPGTNQWIRFRRAGVVRVFCNIHPSMAAVIVVVNSPFYTNADAEGRFRIPDVPDGTYHVHTFDERATGAPQRPILVSIANGQADVTVSPIRISEAGYARPAHKNKFGQDYAPDSDNTRYDGPLK